jgi:hypothetical protein
MKKADDQFTQPAFTRFGTVDPVVRNIAGFALLLVFVVVSSLIWGQDDPPAAPEESSTTETMDTPTSLLSEERQGVDAPLNEDQTPIEPKPIEGLMDTPISFRGIGLGTSFSQALRMIEQNGIEVTIPDPTWLPFTMKQMMQHPARNLFHMSEINQANYASKLQHIISQYQELPFAYSDVYYDVPMARRTNGTLYLKRLSQFTLQAQPGLLLWGDVEQLTLLLFEGRVIGISVRIPDGTRYGIYREKYALEENGQDYTFSEDGGTTHFYHYNGVNVFFEDENSIFRLFSTQAREDLWFYLRWAVMEDCVRTTHLDLATFEALLTEDEQRTHLELISEGEEPTWLQDGQKTRVVDETTYVLLFSEYTIEPRGNPQWQIHGPDIEETDAQWRRRVVEMINHRILQELEQLMLASSPDQNQEIQRIVGTLENAPNTILLEHLEFFDSYWEIQFSLRYDADRRQDTYKAVLNEYELWGIPLERYLTVRNRVIQEYAASPALSYHDCLIIESAQMQLIQTPDQLFFAQTPTEESAASTPTAVEAGETTS